MHVLSHPEVAGVISYDFFTLALLMRRLYRHGAYDVRGTTCHVLAEVLSGVSESYSVVHGGVWGHDGVDRTQHSWLAISGTDWIIDVKPIHCVAFSPLLVYVGNDSVWAGVYEEHRSPALMESLNDPDHAVNCARVRAVINTILEVEPIKHDEIIAMFKGYVGD